jgi:multiple sugar transport system substrate-binding protein
MLSRQSSRRRWQSSRRRWQVPIAVSAVMIAWCGLAACSSQSGGSSGGNSSSNTITLTEEDYYTSGSANTFWNATFAEYHKLHPDVIFKRSAVPNQGYVPHLLNQAGAGALPNLVMIDNPYVAQFAKAGTLTPLQQIGSVDTAGISPSLLHDGLYQGTLYAIPPYTNTIAIFYNKKLFAAAHLSPPMTWAEMAADAKKLATSKVYGFVTPLPAANASAFWSFAPFLWTNAGPDATEHISSPQAVAALSLFAQMAEDGAMPKAAVTWTNSQDVEYFQNGRAAMDLQGSWNIPSFNATKGLSYGVVQIPVRVPGQQLLVPTGGETFAISRTGTTAQQQAALAFLKWLITPQEDAQAAVQVGGLVPTVQAAVSTALPQEDPAMMKPFVTELQNGGTERTQYVGTAYFNVADTIGNAIDAAVLGQETPQQAFSSIAGTVQSELQQDDS